MPWWNQDSVRSFTLGSTLFFAAPELLLRDKGATAVMFYNATVANNKGVTNLYEMAEEGTWTFEQFISLCEEVAASMDGDDLMNSGEDLWGAGMSNDAIFYLFGGSGMKFASVDDYGYVEYQFGSEQSILYLQDIFDYAVYTDALAHPNVVDLNGVNIFRNDCSLFAFGLVKDVLGLRSMESDFGVLPIPKMDETQTGYQTFLHDQFTAFGIVSTVKENRLQMMGAYLEAMAEESYKSLVPTYYELALKTKYVSDEESGQMLDMIYRSVYIDAGVLYTKTVDVHQQLRTIIRSGNNTVASMFKATSKVVSKMITKLNDGLWAIQ
jgi:hypothetical protein